MSRARLAVSSFLARRVLTSATLVWLGASLTGCSLLSPPPPPPPSLESVVPLGLPVPELMTVKRGETLAIIAMRYDITVDELKAWNSLGSDIIEIDQVLLIWTDPLPPPAPEPEPEPERFAALPSFREAIEALFFRTSGSPDPAIPPMDPVATVAMGGAPDGVTPRQGAPRRATPGQGTSGEGTSAEGTSGEGTPRQVAVADPQQVAVAQQPQQRVAIERPALAGLLGLKVGTDVDLADVASGMERHDADLGNTGLGDRSLGSGSEADKLVMAQPKMRNLGPQIPTTPVSAPKLSKPIPKKCLGGPSAVMGEDGSVRSGGLSVGQINAAMGQISRHTVRCFPSGSKGSYALTVEITVGCDGRVSNVYLVDPGVVPPNVTGCVTQTLGYAGFPAHAMPAGVSFQYPMKFTF